MLSKKVLDWRFEHWFLLFTGSVGDSGMMGRQDRDQRRLFYEFNLDDVIPRHHLLRRMNGFVTAALGATCTDSWGPITATSADRLLIRN
jgi:hypothetical protein